MMHPPTYIEGPLQPHELDELSELMDDIEAFVSTLDNLPEHLRIRIPFWGYRLAHIGVRP
jgi:hypothetical protein